MQAADKAKDALPDPPQTGTASASAKKEEAQTQSNSNPLDAIKKAAPASLPNPAEAAKKAAPSTPSAPSLPNPAEAAKKAAPSLPSLPDPAKAAQSVSLPNPAEAAKKAAPRSDFGFDFGSIFSSGPQDAAKKAAGKVLPLPCQSYACCGVEAACRSNARAAHPWQTGLAGEVAGMQPCLTCLVCTMIPLPQPFHAVC